MPLQDLPSAGPLHTGTLLWRAKRSVRSHFFGTKMKNEYVSPSDSDDSSKNEQFAFLLQSNQRVTAVLTPEEAPSTENAVYSQLETFQCISSVQCKYFITKFLLQSNTGTFSEILYKV